MAETEKERIDRELIELLNELRVTLPGVQVLFAFLLILPFQQGWSRVTEFQKDVYFGTFVCAAIAAVLLISPTANHRLNFRMGTEVKERLLFRANRVVIAGTVFLALGLSGAVFLITDILFEAKVAAVTTGLIAFFLAWLWFGIPLLSRARD